MKLLYLKYNIVVWSVLLLLFSCHRRPLEELYEDTALIPIGTVWTKADIEPQNVTALFYSQDDGRLVLEHRFEKLQNVFRHTQVYLPVNILL